MKIILTTLIYLFSFYSIFGQPTMSKEEIENFYTHDKHKNFRLINKVNNNSNALIETNCVYILEFKVEEDGTQRYSYIRFFNNGRVFSSGDYLSVPTSEQLNDIIYGKRGYYIVNDSIIKIEFYVNGYEKYSYFYCRAIDDELIFFKKKIRTLNGAKTKLDLTYKKYITPLNSHACW